MFQYVGDSASAVASAAAVSTSLASVDAQAKKLGTDLNKDLTAGLTAGISDAEVNLGQFAHSEAFGLSRREFTHLSGAATEAFRVVGDVAGQSSKQLTGVVSAVSGIVSAFSFGGELGAGIAAVGVVVAGVTALLEAQAQAEAAAQAAIAAHEAELRSSFESTKASLEGLIHPDPFAALALSIGITSDRLKTLATDSAGARDNMERLTTTQAGIAVLKDRIASITTSLREMKEQASKIEVVDPQSADAARDLADKIAQAESMLRVYTDALAGARVAEAGLTEQIQGTNTELINQAADAAAAAQAVRDLGSAGGSVGVGVEMSHALETNRYLLDQFWALNPAAKTAGQSLDQFNTKQDAADAAAKKLAEDGLAKERAAYQALTAAIKGAVEAAVTPTTVTDADKKATAAGTYKDKWDEFRREVEAVATGTPLGAYGPKFEAALTALRTKTGLTLDQISTKFKDFSLFADKSNLQLINWDAVVGSTADAIQSIIGKFNVVSAGVEAYMNSDEGKAQLPQLKLALGLSVDTSTADVQKALTGALGGITATPQTVNADALGKSMGASATSSGALAANLALINTALPIFHTNITKEGVPGLDALQKKLDGGVNAGVLLLSTNLAASLLSVKNIKSPLDDMGKGLDDVTTKITTDAPTFNAFNLNTLVPLKNTLAEIVQLLRDMSALLDETAGKGKNWQPPPALKPGSPSPLELTLRASTGYLREMAGLFGNTYPGSVAADVTSGASGGNAHGGDAGGIHLHGDMYINSDTPDKWLAWMENKYGASVLSRARMGE